MVYLIKTNIFYNFANQQIYQEHQNAIRKNYESVTVVVVPVYLKQTVNNNTQPTQRYLINQHKAQSRPSYCDYSFLKTARSHFRQIQMTLRLFISIKANLNYFYWNIVAAKPKKFILFYY